MARITKYLNQQCRFSTAKRDRDSQVVTDDYGNALYTQSRIVKCRCEVTHKDIWTTNGVVAKISRRYFLDVDTQPQVDDMLDGRRIVEVEAYTGLTGVIEGYECYV